MAKDETNRTGPWNDTGMGAERPFNISASWSEGAKPSRPAYYSDLRPMDELNANRMPALINRTPATPSGCRPRLASPIEHILAEVDALLLSETSGWQGQLPTKARGADTARTGPRRRFAASALVAALSAGVAGSLLFDWADRNSTPDRSQAATPARSVSAAMEPRPRSIDLPSSASLTPDPTPTNRRTLSTEQSVSWAAQSNARPADRTKAMPASIAADLDASAVDPYAGRVAKPLTGDALESALMADRIATRERNLQQLAHLRRASENGTGMERSDKWR
jgi:hypothetical protein